MPPHRGRNRQICKRVDKTVDKYVPVDMNRHLPDSRLLLVKHCEWCI